MSQFLFSDFLPAEVQGFKSDRVPSELLSGKAHFLRGDIQLALKSYQQAVLNHPSHPLCYLYLGEGLLKLRKIPAALRSYCTGFRLALGSGYRGFGFDLVQDDQNGETIYLVKLRGILKSRCQTLIEFYWQSIPELDDEDCFSLFGALYILETLEDILSDVIEHFPNKRDDILRLKQDIHRRLIGPVITEPQIQSLIFQLQKRIVYQFHEASLNHSLLETIHQVDVEKRSFDHRYAEMLDRLQKVSISSQDDADLLEKVRKVVVSRLKADEFHHSLLNSAYASRMPLENTASFVVSTVMRIRKSQLRGGLPGGELERKNYAYRFVKSLGYMIPSGSDRVVRLAEIEPTENVVIKPLSQANCDAVYMVKNGDDIIDLGRQRRLKGWPELRASLADDLHHQTVREDCWTVQELIYEDREKTQPARDLKFFCFYGQVPWIWETVRFPEHKFCSWDGDFNLIESGVLRDRTRFIGEGVTEEQVALAAAISAKIPTPFIRIDFLKGWQGLAFCEFAVLPGGYSGIKKSLNRRLGECFLEAEARLMEDLLRGKRFEEYGQFRKDMGLADVLG